MQPRARELVKTLYLLPAVISTVAIAFLYFGFMRAGQALGHNGALNPYLAAWLGDLVFGGLGLSLMVQAQRS